MGIGADLRKRGRLNSTPPFLNTEKLTQQELKVYFLIMGMMLIDPDLQRTLEALVPLLGARPYSRPVPCHPVIDPEITIAELPSAPLGAELPNKGVVYFVLTEQSELLYIGQSQSLSQRWIQHHKAKELKRFSNIRIAWYETDDRVRLERKLIVQFSPPLNAVKYRGRTQ